MDSVDVDFRIAFKSNGEAQVRRVLEGITRTAQRGLAAREVAERQLTRTTEREERQRERLVRESVARLSTLRLKADVHATKESVRETERSLGMQRRLHENFARFRTRMMRDRAKVEGDLFSFNAPSGGGGSGSSRLRTRIMDAALQTLGVATGRINAYARALNIAGPRDQVQGHIDFTRNFNRFAHQVGLNPEQRTAAFNEIHSVAEERLVDRDDVLEALMVANQSDGNLAPFRANMGEIADGANALGIPMAEFTARLHQLKDTVHATAYEYPALIGMVTSGTMDGLLDPDGGPSSFGSMDELYQAYGVAEALQASGMSRIEASRVTRTIAGENGDLGKVVRELRANPSAVIGSFAGDEDAQRALTMLANRLGEDGNFYLDRGRAAASEGLRVGAAIREDFQRTPDGAIEKSRISAEDAFARNGDAYLTWLNKVSGAMAQIVNENPLMFEMLSIGADMITPLRTLFPSGEAPAGANAGSGPGAGAPGAGSSARSWVETLVEGRVARFIASSGLSLLRGGKDVGLGLLRSAYPAVRAGGSMLARGATAATQLARTGLGTLGELGAGVGMRVLPHLVRGGGVALAGYGGYKLGEFIADNSTVDEDAGAAWYDWIGRNRTLETTHDAVRDVVNDPARITEALGTLVDLFRTNVDETRHQTIIIQNASRQAPSTGPRTEGNG